MSYQANAPRWAILSGQARVGWLQWGYLAILLINAYPEFWPLALVAAILTCSWMVPWNFIRTAKIAILTSCVVSCAACWYLTSLNPPPPTTGILSATTHRLVACLLFLNSAIWFAAHGSTVGIKQWSYRVFLGMTFALFVVLLDYEVPPEQQDFAFATLFLGLGLFVFAVSSNFRTDRSSILPATLLAMAFLVTLPALSVWGYTVRHVQKQTPGWLATRVGRGLATRPYPRVGTLNNIWNEQTYDPNQVALTVYCDRVPGYLRGRAYDTYRNGMWELSNRRRRNIKDKRSLNPIQPPVSLKDVEHPSTFAIQPRTNSGGFLSMKVINHPGRGDVWFLPTGTNYVSGAGKYLIVDDFDIIYQGLEVDEAYSAHLALGRRDANLPSQLRNRLLSKPRGLTAYVAQLANRICQDSENATEKIQAVQNYFQDNYEYTLEPFKVPSGNDPISYFLARGRAAHCEFYAASAAALLRLEGVPCLYVTGYICSELEDEYGDFWQSRNRHAHAWVEAYDEDKRQWTIVEATPGFQVPDRDSQQRDSSGENVVIEGREQSSLKQLTLLQELFRKAYSELATLWPFILLGLACIALCALGRWWIEQNKLPRSVQVRRRCLNKVQKPLSKIGLIRQPHETLHQFAHRIEATELAWTKPYAEFYRRYADMLYSAQTTFDDASLESLIPH